MIKNNYFDIDFSFVTPNDIKWIINPLIALYGGLINYIEK